MTTELGSVKLFHPRGPAVTLPVPADPRAAFAHIALCLDAGWLVCAPGLSAMESREDVGYVLRGSCDTGQATPYLLLYSANEGLSYSFLKVYLDREQDVLAFETASGMRVADLPEYVGADKPQRGKSPKLDAYIVRVKRPLAVIHKPHPKYDEAQRAMVQAKGEIYKVPARIFVRWADQPQPNGTPATAPATGHTTKPINVDAEVKKALEAFAAATSSDTLEQWRQWAFKIPGRTAAHNDELDLEYKDAKTRLTRQPSRRTA